jgi:hypothetical protein
LGTDLSKALDIAGFFASLFEQDNGLAEAQPAAA